MLLYRIYKNSSKNTDHDNPEHIHRLNAAVNISDPAGTDGLFGGDYNSETVHLAFGQCHRNVQHYSVFVEHDIGQLYSLEPGNRQ